MTTSRLLGVSLGALALSLVPFVAAAQVPQYSQVIVTTQTLGSTPAPTGSPVVTVTAAGPSLTGIPVSNSSTLSFGAAFNGDTHTVTFIPGSYTVAATGAPGYYFLYSQGCSGFTAQQGSNPINTCTITLTTTPPQQNLCGGLAYGCGQPVVPYQGPTYPTTLSCTPDYQTVAAGQSATFTALGGTGTPTSGYNWATADRTFINTGNRLTTLFQSTGTQTVIVSNGVQSATCTVTVTAPAAGVPVTYTPSTLVSNYIPNTYLPTLPNTGFSPLGAGEIALALALVLGLGIYLTPHVRKAIAIVSR